MQSLRLKREDENATETLKREQYGRINVCRIWDVWASGASAAHFMKTRRIVQLLCISIDCNYSLRGIFAYFFLRPEQNVCFSSSNYWYKPPPPPIPIPTIRSLLLLIVEDWQKKIKASVIVMPCNIFRAKPESFSAIRKNVNRGGRKKKKWLIENIKRFLNYFWKETHETGCGGKIILIICIVSQEEKACCVAFTVSAPMEMCAILSGEPHETPPVYVLFPSVRSVPTLAAVLPSAQQ